MCTRVVNDARLESLVAGHCTQGFAWHQDYGSRNFQPIRQGETIGHHGSAPHVVDRDSVIIFPKVRELWVQGCPLYWLAARRPTLPS
jgi:hypothetical protein